MAIVHVLAVIVIGACAALTVVMFIAIFAAAVLVTWAVRYEERHLTLTGPAPGRRTWLARRLLGVPEVIIDEQAADLGPEEEPPWYERTAGPSRR